MDVVMHNLAFGPGLTPDTVALAFVNHDMHAIFECLDDNRKKALIRECVVARHSEWEAALWLTVYDVATADVPLEWYERHVPKTDDRWRAGYHEWILMHAGLSCNLADFSDIYNRHGSPPQPPERHIVKVFDRASDMVSAEWCARVPTPPSRKLKCLYKSQNLRPELGRDWYAAVFIGKPVLLLRALELSGLVTPECGADWYSTAFKGQPQLLFRALELAGLLTPERGPEWYAAHMTAPYHGTETLATALRRTGLTTSWYVGADWYAKRFKGVELTDMLRAAGLMHSGHGRNWYAKALEFVDNDDEPCNYEVYTGALLASTLREAGLLTSRCGKSWYVKHMREGVAVGVLAETGLLNRNVRRDWCAKNFSGDHLVACLRHAGLLTPECGRDWYAKALGKGWCGETLIGVLRETGLLNADAGEEWYTSILWGESLFVCLKESGLLGRRDFDWYVSTFANYGKNADPMFSEMVSSGILEGVSRDRLVAAFKSKWLFRALSKCGLLTMEPGPEWYVDAFSDDYGNIKTKHVYESWKRAGFLAPGTGIDREMLAKVLDKDELIKALDDTGLLTTDVSMDWYDDLFSGRRLFDVLCRSGHLHSRTDFKWCVSAFGRNPRLWYECARIIRPKWEATDLEEYKGNGRRVVDRRDMRHFYCEKIAVLLDAPTSFVEEGTACWYAARQSGRELYLTLLSNGLLKDRIRIGKYSGFAKRSWFAVMFSGNLLLGCLIESGILAHVSVNYLMRHFKRRKHLSKKICALRQDYALRLHVEVGERCGSRASWTQTNSARRINIKRDLWRSMKSQVSDNDMYESDYERRSRAPSDDIIDAPITANMSF